MAALYQERNAATTIIGVPLSPGVRLGPYAIVHALGTGGMGEVYRARDTRLDRDVAIKVLPDTTAHDHDARSRFEREAKAVAALNHPNILAIHDVGEADGRIFAVTELLEGETLRSRMNRTPLTWQQAVDTTVAVAEGLSPAHARGIIHRDLKPENVFVTSDGRVKVLDFGLARWESEERADASPTVTMPGTILGTVGYMSPEQARGGACSAPSDIFSLGTMLFEMLTGKRAFDRPTAAETMSAIINDEVPTAALADRHLPSGLDRIVSHCLEKKPQNRFQSGRDLVFNLRALGENNDAAAAEASDVIDSLAVLPFSAGAHVDLDYLGEGIAESLINSLSQVPGLRLVPRSRAFRFKGQEVDPQEVGRQLKVRALLSGRVQQRGDVLNVQVELVDVQRDSQLWGERFNRKTTDLFSVEDEIASQISEKLRLKLSGADRERLARHATGNVEAYHLYLKGRFQWNKRTGDGIRHAREFFQQAATVDPAFALAHAGLADAYLLMYAFSSKPELQFGKMGRAAAQRALELDPQLAEAPAALCVLRWASDWDAAGAVADARRATELNPQYPLGHTHRAIVLSALGRHDEALASVMRGFDLDPTGQVTNHHLTWVLIRAGRYDEAIDRCRKALEFDPQFATARAWLGLALSLTGNADASVAEFRTAHESTGFDISAFELVRALALAGRRDEAEAVLATMQAKFDRDYADPYGFAIAHASLGRHDEAFAWLDRALSDRNLQAALHVNGDPRLAPIASDPRMTAILQRMRLRSEGGPMVAPTIEIR